MGNCQAIDAATLVIQHPSGKVDKLYWPVTACEIMKTNPGHYVALLITTTLYKSNSSTDEKDGTSTTVNKSKDHNNSRSNKDSKQNKIRSTTNIKKQNNDRKDTNVPRNSSSSTTGNSLRVTRVKLLRPTDILTLGHVYRLISTKEVMKGLVAKKQAKLKKQGIEFEGKIEENMDLEKLSRRPQLDKNNQAGKQERHRSRSSGSANGGAAKPKLWQPRLQSISEATS